MGRALKYFFFLLGGIVALLVVAAIGFVLLFDPNDFRERIAAETKRMTGRDLAIEGDLEVSLFPWLAIGVGRTSLGNAEGFGDEPFASFDSARLSVRVMPLLLRREITVGTAELDSLVLNLAVARNGRSNWQDLIEAGEAAPEEAEPGAGVVLDIASIDVRDSAITYSDAQTGDTYRLTNVNMTSGRVAAGEPVPLSGGLDFELQPAALSGTVEVETVATFDADAATIRLDDLSVDSEIEGLADVPATIEFRAPSVVARTGDQVLEPGELELSVFDIDVTAAIEPFSYAASPEPAAAIRVAAFSPKSLMRRLNIDVPPTADPDALGRLRLAARAKVGASAIALSDVEMVLDDTTVKGTLSLPREAGGTLRFDLVGDTINLARYMAPAEQAETTTTDEVPVEIPVELIRALNARGSLKVNEGYLGDLRFTNVELGLNSSDGRLRLQPIGADLYGGKYTGDVRVDAAGQVPAISVNEKIAGVQVGSLVAAIFEKENVSGTINGSFVLAGSGPDLSAIQRDLDGSMSLELIDGAFEGKDIWWEVRRAYALVKQQPVPERELPARTRFSNIRVQGPVSDGVFDNPDLFAELPFMQVNGKGTVDLAAATMDYRLSARVLDKPELAGAATPDEIRDLTKAVIPLRIDGALADPNISIDVEGMLKERVQQEIDERKDELKERLLDKVLGGAGADTEEAPAEEGDAEPAEPAEEEEEQDLEEELKKQLLRKIFER